EDVDVPCFCSQRWILAYIGFLGFGVVYALRVNLSVAVVCMVKSPVTDDVINWNVSTPYSIENEFCVEESKEASHSNDIWWEAGVVCRHPTVVCFNPRYADMRAHISYSGLRHTGSPWTFDGDDVSGDARDVGPLGTAAREKQTDYSLLCRYGRMHISVKFAISVHIPGTTLGFVATFSTSGVLCEYGFDNGWGSIFYLTAADTPSRHPRISGDEVKYIKGLVEYNTEKREGSIPWRAILTAPCLWATLTAHVCNNWTNYTLLTNIPTFMKEVLKFDIKVNGGLSSIPYVCQFVSALLAGQLADYIRQHGWMNTTRTRKVFQTIAFLGAGGCLVATGYCTCENRSVAVALLSLAVMCMGFGRAGYVVNHVDFAPKYAGLLFGITNTIATIPGMVAPIYAGYMTP
ncbi:SL172-like protein, partial [Mya arenaria]